LPIDGKLWRALNSANPSKGTETNMNRNQRRAAREAKHYTAYGIEHSTDGFRAGGNHLVAAQDEPEPGATPEERRLAAMFGGGAAADHLKAEDPTEYAQRRARENDRRALDAQVNDPLVR
jgi:hypothetical protein